MDLVNIATGTNDIRVSLLQPVAFLSYFQTEDAVPAVCNTFVYKIPVLPLGQILTFSLTYWHLVFGTHNQMPCNSGSTRQN